MPLPSTKGQKLTFMKLSLLLLIATLALAGCVTSSTPPPDTVNERSVRDVYVRSAQFGSGTHIADVTDRVAELLKREPGGFWARADWLRVDPLPGKAKSLLIDYDYKGKPFRISIVSPNKISYDLLVENARK
jgi:hypothetical protein